jgi:hypothetical protein
MVVEVEADPASGDKLEVEDKAVNGWLAEKGSIVAHPPDCRIAGSVFPQACVFSTVVIALGHTLALSVEVRGDHGSTGERTLRWAALT